MAEIFWNRKIELVKIQSFLNQGVFGCVVGRRRVGKTALLTKTCADFRGFYHQAIEGTTAQQIEHLVLDLKIHLPIFATITPKTWSEFFGLLSRETLPPLMVFDEFPYWVAADANLPSILQKWIDHSLPKQKTLLLISGSSQAMMHSQVLRDNAPLYGRALLFERLQPLSYSWFCHALKLPIESENTFQKFSLVGGIPHYWKMLDKQSFQNQVERLFFSPSAILSEEPRLILHDEGITGNVPKAILDLIGRGVSKPSEMAARLGVPQTHLSRSLAILVELGLVSRDLPFGESTRTTKRVVYCMEDPALSFYYGICLPNRGNWSTLSQEQKMHLLNLHVSRQWEFFCRRAFPGSARHWEGNLEIDIVAPLKKGETLIAECKWIALNQAQKMALLKELQQKFARSSLSHKIFKPVFRIFDKKCLKEVLDQP